MNETSTRPRDHGLAPVKTVGRLTLYRRILARLVGEGYEHVFSHQIAGSAGGSAAQVRRDLMLVGCRGKPSRGYDAQGLMTCIESFLQAPDGQRVALVGLGHLGRAVLPYFARYRPALRIVAVFDNDPNKIGETVVEGCCPCMPTQELPRVVTERGITVGVLAVPGDAAQAIADELIDAGVRGLVNFAPIALRVPEGVFVEDVDLTMALEKVAYFAHATGSGASSAGVLSC
jgi:redox-sensing transcriptional repressor